MGQGPCLGSLKEYVHWGEIMVFQGRGTSVKRPRQQQNPELEWQAEGLPWWHSGNLPANAGDKGSIPTREDPTCHRATKPVRHNY